MGCEAVAIAHDGARATSVTVRDKNGHEETLPADYVLSTTDLRFLGNMLCPAPPPEVREITDNLAYRDFLTVGLLLEKKPREKNGAEVADTWMYIHEPGVSVGRVQFFHNWSPGMTANPENGWVGLEYFCNEGDRLWNMNDDELVAFASEELETVGLCGGIPVIGGVVIRQSKAYPAYVGSYAKLPSVREYLGGFSNFFPIGRNGMHRYNNQDHSMLAAMTAVDLIAAGSPDKNALWEINTEEEYLEEKR
jgi:protoporphyrinogen oxidase